MTSRPRKLALAGAALVCAVALSGCQVHPGAAAVVDGQAISQSSVDDLVLAGCAFSKAGREATGSKQPGTSMAYLRTFFLQDLITFQITHRATTALHLRVSQAKIAEATQGQTVPPSLSSSDRDLLERYFADAARSQIEQAVIGAHLKDPSVTNADKVTPNDINASKKWLAKYTARQHVVVNPAYGTWNGQSLVPGEGSLSVPISSDARTWDNLRVNAGTSVEGLPPSQVCG